MTAPIILTPAVVAEQRRARLRDEHGYHKATPETAIAHDAIREAVINLALTLDQILPAGWEARKAQETLHEVRMWSNMAVAVHGAPLAREDEKRVPNDPHGQGAEQPTMKCGGCGETVVLMSSAFNGSLNPHWGGETYACRSA